MIFICAWAVWMPLPRLLAVAVGHLRELSFSERHLFQQIAQLKRLKVVRQGQPQAVPATQVLTHREQPLAALAAQVLTHREQPLAALAAQQQPQQPPATNLMPSHTQPVFLTKIYAALLPCQTPRNACILP